MEPSGRPSDGVTKVTLFRYDSGRFTETALADLGSLEGALNGAGVLWLNVTNAGAEPELVRRVGHAVGLHPLALDDVLNEGQRPHAEEYGDQFFVLLRTLRVKEPSTVALGSVNGADGVTGLPTATELSEAVGAGLHSSQVALLLKERLVVTFLESAEDPFDRVRTRPLGAHGAGRELSADFLAYRLLDVIIGQYFGVVERYGDDLEALEDQILLHPTRSVLRQVNGLRRDLLLARRTVWPLRDAMSRLQQPGSNLVSADTATYLRDAQSNVMQVIETLELLREMVTGLHDIYLTALNTRMNDIIKVLTIISTIFIPLTFLAGIYGMNFEHQPEYAWRWAYPALWGLMILLAAGMLALFRRKRWL